MSQLKNRHGDEYIHCREIQPRSQTIYVLKNNNKVKIIRVEEIHSR